MIPVARLEHSPVRDTYTWELIAASVDAEHVAFHRHASFDWMAPELCSKTDPFMASSSGCTVVGQSLKLCRVNGMS